jgi:hypothetical protein
MLYVWKEYTANLSGTVVRRVACEKCQCKYAYELTRKACGKGTSVYMLNNAGAQDRAQAQASKRLRRQLERGIEPVGCPDCGWYPADMVAEAKRRRMRPIIWIASVMLALAGAYGLIVGMLMATSPPQSTGEPHLLGSLIRAGGLAGLAILLLAIRWIVVRKTEPNRGYPERPAPYPGAPLGHKVEAPAAAAAGTVPHRVVRTAAAVGAYPAPPPRSLKPSSKVPPRT